MSVCSMDLVHFMKNQDAIMQHILLKFYVKNKCLTLRAKIPFKINLTIQISHPHRLIRVFAFRYLESLVPLFFSCGREVLIRLRSLSVVFVGGIYHFHAARLKKYSRLSLSRLRLSRITAYLEEKILSLL